MVGLAHDTSCAPCSFQILNGAFGAQQDAHRASL